MIPCPKTWNPEICSACCFIWDSCDVMKVWCRLYGWVLDVKTGEVKEGVAIPSK